MRLLGIDYGTKRIGLALSSGDIATPEAVLDASTALNDIVKIVKSERVNKIVIGLSLNYKGEPNPLMERMNKFIGKLESETGIQIILQNEVLTSAEADRIIGKDQDTDARDAAIILQSSLDKNANS